MSSAISSRKQTDASGCLIAFFALFAIIGLVVFTVNFILPVVAVLRAQNWTPTPCTIQSSAIASRGSGKDLKYYPDVLFEYSVNGQTYDSTRFSFFKLGFKNSYDPQSMVNAYPAGSRSTCFVNPSNPAEAVLDRSFHKSALTNLIALVFVAAGVGGIAWQVLSRRAVARNQGIGQKSWRPKLGAPTNASVATVARASDEAPFASTTTGSASWQPQSTSAASEVNATEGILLKPTVTPAGAACGLLLIALFWNGIVGVFLRVFFYEMKGAEFMRIFLGLFLIPFVIIGLLLIVGVLSSLGALFVPRPRFSANASALPLGGTLRLDWKTRRGLFNAQKLKIWLEAREEATYTRGTDTVTDKNVFLSRTIFENAAGAKTDGSADIEIPADAMHSFEAPRNKILWAIKVKGDVPLWPNFEEEYRIVVLPTHQNTASQTARLNVSQTANT